ncbi:RNA polymerase subunit sigma [Curtobacterium sp. MCBD17_034]|uniref:ECF RNA polymerase sigma factor SigK n=1 Tax=unclassified Curtobacterium TaxID=257496 RepID=UPI000DA85AFE|nr:MULTISPECIES: ECF RNA polymerase sigma factor SigK [unclassified Curtobacterium]PZE76077.1 RNA polymerase subunit sigma [Curtobacterium sp. MCBD17_019]PZF56825.1 RNA polymerase subunit sigma [Curtobacterium sp. MCBD17_013]PZF60279.1 RNA polymerase subunit sigma [Curtobacterium sp. MCBD17_034]PZM34964.1 RNA polymerase subunit sigma [Curtobacterium sp. MCBD17_031]WIB63269.1 ECF RNA polymerase sigma factor SigK [Curtobacterium sp. MCBD17_040]
MLTLVERDTNGYEAPSSPLVASPDELLTRVAAGDQEAFGALYDQLSGRVMGLITRLLRDHAQSEEVTQEVFLEVWQNASRFDAARGSAPSWILTMAHRRAVDRVRAAQSSRDRDTKVGIRDFETDFDSVTESVEIRIEHERVSRALARLTEFQRQAVTMAYYGGYSHSEMAAILGVPIGTVKTRLRDGMIRLRDEMGVRS